MSFLLKRLAWMRRFFLRVDSVFDPVWIQNMVRSMVGLIKTRNIIIASVMHTTGMGGAELTAESSSHSETGLVTMVRVVLKP